MNLENIPLFNLKDSDYVLDIGGGHVPFSRANVIVDKFPEEEFDQPQRANCPIKIPEGAKFIKADAASMPFIKDKEFDFVVCAETLNHVEDPIAVCSEIIRVGKRGYIEIPGVLHEIFVSHLEHLWVCLWDGKTLKFIRNNYPENTIGGLNQGIKIKDYRIQNEGWRILNLYRKLIYIEFVWEGNFNYELI